MLPRRQVLPGGLQLHVGSSLPKAKSKIVPAQPERDMTQGTVLDPSLGTGQHASGPAMQTLLLWAAPEFLLCDIVTY